MTDYSDTNNWYRSSGVTKDVDTFFIYPTLYNGMEDGDPDYASIDNAEMRASVPMVYQLQACAFADCTNIFIPYYRQASLKAEVRAGINSGVLEASPLEDINAALDYYFQHYNEGRPFIFAGHSQGAAVAKLALKTFFKEHPEHYSRMVAAYIIGFSVTQQDLDDYPHLKFATGETDTGVIVSWNTENHENVETNAYNIVVLKGSIAINPLNWKRDETYAPASLNLGSMEMDEKTGKITFEDIGADAQVNMARGVVVTNAKAEPLADFTEYFGPGSFHKGDYAFYFKNIGANAAKRIAAFKKNR